MKVYRAFAYYRLSKEDYALISPKKTIKRIKDESNSITNQKNLICKYLKDKADIILVDEYKDDGYTGLDFERPNFQQMMSDIKKYEIDCIIVKDFSRFGRDYLETCRYIERILPALGIRFISINDNYDSILRTQVDNIILPFTNLLNDNYSRDTSKKILSHMAVKRIDGEYIAPFTVYGYLKSPDNHNKLIPDSYAATVVSNIFKMKIDGMSQKRIAEYLNASGILSPLEYKKYSGSHYKTSFKIKEHPLWSENSVNRILVNRVYIGDTEQGKIAKINYKTKKRKQIPREEWITKENTHEPIIDEDTFLIVQRLLEIDTRVAPGQKTLYLFSGLLKCADCGQNMIKRTEKHGANTYEYYICSTYKNKKGCSSHRINVKKLYDTVFKTIHSYVELVADLEQIVQRLDSESYYQKQKNRMETELSILTSYVEDIYKRKQYLYEDFKSGILDSEDYKELKTSYSEELQELNNKKNKVEVEIADHNLIKNENLKWIEKFKSHKDFTKLERSMLVSLIHYIKVYNSQSLKIIFYYKDDFERLKDLIKTEVG